MHVLDVVTILLVGLMIGNELAVSLFVNPVMWQLDNRSQTQALNLFARILGKAMPTWYALCLVLMLVEAYVRRHEQGLALLMIAASIWIVVILLTVMLLVPINNRVSAMTPEIFAASGKIEHKKWDTMHRWRVLALTVAMVCLLEGILR
jgi:Domain of unknown function (DUF1772)